MSTTRKTRAILDELWGRLWSGGLTDPFIAIEQIAYLMALRRLPAAESGPLQWTELLRLDDEDLIDRLQADLVPLLAKFVGPALRPTMEEARFAIDDPELVRSCLSLIERLDSEEPGVGGEAFDALLEQMQTSKRGGELRTPPRVAKTMVELVNPGPGDSVCDPAAGTAGLLLAASEHAGRDVAISGFDINPGMARLGALNLLFHGIDGAEIAQADVLSSGFKPGRFDIVLTCPPFGGLRGGEEVDEGLSAVGHRTELLFLERCRQMLKGRAAILVPEAVLFGREGQFIRARKEWLQRSNVCAVVLLPAGLLGFTRIRSAILVASTEGVTDEVWFCPISPERANTKGGNPDQDLQVEEGLASVAEALSAKLRGERPRTPGAIDLSGRMFSASIEAIKDHNWSLSPALYRESWEIEQPSTDPLSLLDELQGGEEEIGRLLADAKGLIEESQ